MAEISEWTEGILLTLTFIGVLTIIIAGFNIDFNKNKSLGLSDNSTEQLFIDYQDTAQDQINGGEVEFDSREGITLKSSYGLAKDLINILWNFFSGGFIEKIAVMLNVGQSGMLLAKALRIIWFLSLVGAILYASFKVKL